MTMHRTIGCLLLLLMIGTIPGQAQTSPAELEAREPEEMVEMLVLSDESALQVLDLLEQLTGKIILRRQDISPAKINFNSRGPLTQAEAVLALESLLTLNGIMLTDMGGKFMKAVPATDVNRHVPEMILGSTLDRAASQQIYAKLFQLDYLNADQANGTIIAPLLSQNSGIVLFPKSNALLITDALVNLQRIETILNEADRPQVVRENIEFIKLDYIQAREMQEQLNNLIEGPLRSYLEGSTSVTADERTNQLIVITHPGNMEMIQRVIESVDVDAAPLTSSEVFQLRQAKAEEVVPIIEDIISGQREGREEDAKVARENRENARNTPQPNNQTNNNQPAPEVVVENTVLAGGVLEANASLQFSNFVGLSADERTNSIVAYGTQQDLKTLRDLIEKIDIPLPQVLIEVIITEVNLGDNQVSGLESFGLTYDPASDVANYVGSVVLPGFGDEGINYSLKPFTIAGVLQAAESDRDIQVLSTPRIVVSHNEEAVIKFGQSRPFVTSTTQGINTDSLERSQVEYRDVGIQLTVTPLIGSDGTVQMTVEQTVDNVIPDDNATFDRPIIGNREASSTISVKSGQMIILGGLQENRREETNRQFPFIGHFAPLDYLFGEDRVDWTRDELIIFMRPIVLENPSIASDVTKDTVEKSFSTEAINKYLDDGTTGRIHLEGSKFEKEEEEPVEIDDSAPRSINRL